MKFTQTHEWIRIDGKVGTIGVTDHARAELGSIVHIELPKLGHSIRAGEEICVLESTKAAADIYSPASGKIIAVNPASLDHINHTPEQEGWLVQIECTDLNEVDRLLSRLQYNQLIDGREA